MSPSAQLPSLPKWQVVLILGFGASMIAAYLLFVPLRADVPVRWALGKTLGEEAGQIEISEIRVISRQTGSWARFDLVCGWAGKSRPRAFAAIVEHTGGGRRRSKGWNRVYWLNELVIQPPPGRPWLERETDLLDVCFAPARR